jgi:hypothetical protein
MMERPAMDLLKTAVVDIGTLIATHRALKKRRLDGDLAALGKRRDELRDELKRGTAAYIDTLARSRRGAVDDALLSACRLAAEQQMPRAARQQAKLKHLMANEPGVLAGVAATRHDLWRLAQMAIYLRIGCAALREAGATADLEALKAPGGGLGRRLRRALVAYARASHRGTQDQQPLIVRARQAALKKIGRSAITQADRLGDVEARCGATGEFVRHGVCAALHDLMRDWCHGDATVST